MRARDTVRLNALRMLKSAMKNAAIEKGGAESVLDDAEAAAVIRKQIKQRQDAIEGFEKGGRLELAASERAEIEILSAYLPKALSPDEVARAGEGGNRRGRRDFETTDGSGDENRDRQGGRPGRWKDPKRGSAEASLLNNIPPDLAAIVVAAGASRRMGFDKISAPLGGRPLIAHSLSAFNDCPDVDHIVLVCAADRIEEFQRSAAEFPKVRQSRCRRQGTGANPCSQAWRLSPDPRPIFVAVHDGARPLITPEAVSACYQAAREFGASVSAEPVTDTLHRVNNQLLTVETVSRKNLWRMQTPQILELDGSRVASSGRARGRRNHHG